MYWQATQIHITQPRDRLKQWPRLCITTTPQIVECKSIKGLFGRRLSLGRLLNSVQVASKNRLAVAVRVSKMLIISRRPLRGCLNSVPLARTPTYFPQSLLPLLGLHSRTCILVTWVPSPTFVSDRLKQCFYIASFMPPTWIAIGHQRGCRRSACPGSSTTSCQLIPAA